MWWQPLGALLLLLVVSKQAEANYDRVKLVNGGYEGVTIAINPQVSEDSNIIVKLKQIFTDASYSLWKSTRGIAHFRDVTILVPETWTSGTYEQSGRHSYEKSDILVAKPHPDYGDRPYTLQYGECGEPGQYIHLTPSYVTDESHFKSYGPKGKVIVHEWAHLRWGVFDEAPESDDVATPNFYYHNGTLEATRCPLSVKGENLKLSADGATVEACHIDPQTGLPSSGDCKFYPHSVQNKSIKASMMAFPYLDQVEHFCHDDPSDPDNLHNRDAPNQQNRLCEQQSTWGVISKSRDLTTPSSYPTTSTNSTIPRFDVVQASVDHRFVLVLDTSGSMSSPSLSGKQTKMREAISASLLFINEFAPPTSSVGIVDFDSSAKINIGLHKLATDVDRNQVVASLPLESDASGGTTIEKGVLKAVELLQMDSSDLTGARVLLLTDGQGSWSDEAEKAITDNGIIFSTIFFGVTSANEFLQNLTEFTGGVWDFSNKIEGLLGTFVEFGRYENGDFENETFQIQSETYTIGASLGYAYEEIVIDFTLGRDTRFTFTYSGNIPPYIYLFDPTGKRYCSDSIPAAVGCDASMVGQVDSVFSIITFKMAAQATAGSWYVLIQRAASTTDDLEVTSSVSSMTTPGVEPIVLRAGMSTQEVGLNPSPVTIYARITQGFEPILNATVVASVTHPDGSYDKVLLFDRGAAPDTRKNDGVYTRTFTNFTSPGRYSLKVKVSTSDGSWSGSGTNSGAIMNFGTIASNGSLIINPNALAQMQHDSNSKKMPVSAQRVQSPGGFSYSGPVLSAASLDRFPPSKVIDLRVEQVNVNDASQGFRLRFTAPGDDYDFGKATSYDFRYQIGGDSSALRYSTGFEMASRVMVTSARLPRVSGTDEVVFFVPTDLPKEDVNGVVRLSVAMRATDEAGNVAKISNVALTNLFLISPKNLPVKPSCAATASSKSDDVIAYFRPADCKYYACDGGSLKELICPAGAAFDPHAGFCRFYTPTKCIVNPKNSSYVAQKQAMCKNDKQCESEKIAGPFPYGFTSQAECVRKGSCWDAKEGRCKCEGDCPALECPAGGSVAYIGDPNDCSRYYKCVASNRIEMICPAGQVYSGYGNACLPTQLAKLPCGFKP